MIAAECINCDALVWLDTTSGAVWTTCDCWLDADSGDEGEAECDCGDGWGNGAGGMVN